MTKPDPQHSLQQLEAKISAVKKRHAPKPRVDREADHAHIAWRMVIEMVAGLGIGFGIGYGLDFLFNTLPIFMMLFTLLGFAAGIKTMLKSAQEAQEKQMARAADRDEGA